MEKKKKCKYFAGIKLLCLHKFIEGQCLPFRRQGFKKQTTELACCAGLCCLRTSIYSTPAPASFLPFALISIYLSNLSSVAVVFFPFHSSGFSSCLSCWFLCHLIQPPPAISASFILALSWSLQSQAMEMRFPAVLLFSQRASEGLSLMLLSSLWCSWIAHEEDSFVLFF